jgi:hypothetical protein
MANGQGQDRIEVVSPEGKHGTIPRSQLKAALGQGYTRPSALYRFGTNVEKGFAGIGGSLLDILNPTKPLFTGEPTLHIGHGPMLRTGTTDPSKTMTGQYIAQPMQQQEQQAVSAAQTGHPLSAAGHMAAAAVPVIGPGIASLWQQAQGGDVAGAAGQMLPWMLLDSAAKGKIPGETAIKTGVELAKSAAVEGPKAAAREVLRAGKPEVEDAYKKYVEKVSEREAKVSEAQAKHAADVAKAQDEHISKLQELQKEKLSKVQGAREAVRMREYAESKKAALDAKHETLTTALDQNVKATEKAVHENLQRRWNEFDSKMAGATADLAPVQDAIRYAHDDILRGSKEKIGIFNSILAEGESPQEQALSQASVYRGPAGGAAAGSLKELLGSRYSDPNVVRRLISQLGEETVSQGQALSKEAKIRAQADVPFKDARGYWTELGRKLFAGNMLGDVYYAVKHVYDSLGQSIEKLIEKAGLSDEYSSLKKEWSSYMKTFHDMGSIATGGSPLARIVRAQDPGFVSQAVEGKAGQRAVRMLAKYKDFGADPKLASELRSVADQRKSLRVPRAGRAELPPEEKAVPKYGEPKPPELPKEIGKFDPEEVRRQGVKQTAREWRRPSAWWDLMMPLYGLMRMNPELIFAPLERRILARMIEHPKLVEWIAKSSPEELAKYAGKTPTPVP